MKNCLLYTFICLVTGCCLAWAKPDVRGSIHWPHDGDRVKKTHYDYVGVPLDTTVWDFSHAREAGERHEMCWLNLGDSVLICMEQGCQSFYQLHGDTLLWNGYENALFGVHDSIAPIETLTALSNGHNFSTPMYFHGRYSDNHAVDMVGHHDVTLGRTGTLIMPNDTLDNILNVNTTRDCLVRVSRNLNDEPINTGMDSLLREVETINRWYSSAYRYPLAECIKHSYYLGNELLGENRITYLCTPDEQEYALGVLVDPETLLRNAVGEGSHSTHGVLGANTSLADCVTVKQSAERIDVTINVAGLGKGEVSVLLCDLQGHVWNYFTGNANGGFMQHGINIVSLSPGYYLLHIINENEKHVERIRIK